VELLLGRVAARTVEGYRVGDEALVPLRAFLELARVRVRQVTPGRLEAVLEPGGRPLVVDRGAAVARAGDRRVPLDTGRVVADATELYVPTGVLEALLRVRVLVDWGALTVVVPDPRGLPVHDAAVREEARRAFLRAGAVERADRYERLPRAGGGLSLDYALTLPSSSPVEEASYAVRGGLDLLGGSLEAGVASIGPARDGEVRVDASWLGVWRGARWVQQARLGSGVATGPRATTITGASVTNAPYVRPALLGVLPFAGQVGAGWTVEAYRGGQLVAYDTTRSDGRFELGFPVFFGENPIDFAAYGPNGEVVRYNRTVRLPATLLPARRLEYGLSGGASRFVSCDAAANADLRYGVSRRWTLQAGLDQFWRDTLADVTAPYAGAFGALTNVVGVSGEAVLDGFVRGAVNVEPSLDLRFTAAATAFADSAPALLAGVEGRTAQLFAGAFWRPDPRLDFTYVEASWQRTTIRDGALDVVRAGGALQRRELRVLPFVQYERRAVAASVLDFWVTGLTALVTTPSTWGAAGRWFLRAGGEFEDASRLRVASLQLVRQVCRELNVDLGATWFGGEGRPLLQASLNLFVPQFRATATGRVDPSGASSGLLSVQGSLMADPVRGAFATSPLTSVERGGLSGQVYLDRDADGRRGPGEPGLPGVRLQVGSQFVRTDRAGRYRLTDLLPFEPVLLQVDSLSLEDPLWRPGQERVSVEPPPNRFVQVDVPIVPTQVLEGRVERVTPDGPVPFAGATLELVAEASGRSLTLTTFTDGSFYVLGVRPGRYRLGVSAEVLAALRLEGEVAILEVSPDPDVPPAPVVLRVGAGR